VVDDTIFVWFISEKNVGTRKRRVVKGDSSCPPTTFSAWNPDQSVFLGVVFHKKNMSPRVNMDFPPGLGNFPKQNRAPPDGKTEQLTVGRCHGATTV